MRRAALLLLICLVPARAAGAQESSVTPAALLLRMRETLRLDTGQVRRLRELDGDQSPAMAAVTAAFLRAEADVVASSAGRDATARRSALEKRAKLAIDAEVARMKWERDARAVLTPSQNETLPASLTAVRGAAAALWQPLTTPLHLQVEQPQPVDSGEVRVSVTPNYADIFVDGERRGTGRRFVPLPVGQHEVELSAVNCERKRIVVQVVKQQPSVITETLTCGK